MTTSQSSSPLPKLACRNVWKVYVPNPSRYFATSMTDPAQIARDIRASGAIPAAAGISFDVYEDEIFVIMGLSGSGKSTMLRCLSR